MNKTAEQAAENAANEYMNSNFRHYQDIGWSDAEFAFIAGAAWQAAQSQWIKINSEKDLPEPITLCFIWTTISIQPTLGYYFNDWMYFSVNGNFWIKDQPHIQVTHWQPLPKPPIE